MKKPSVIFEATNPNYSSYCPQAQDWDVRRNIILPLCGAIDSRLLCVVDGLPQCLCDQIKLMQLHKAGLWIVWKSNGYECYLAWAGKKGVVSSGVHFLRRGIHICQDYWNVYHLDTQGENLLEPW